MPPDPPDSPNPARIPAATYRLQFSRNFTLWQATQLVPYLHELGISHLYASPLLMARPGSEHGYDVCDFQQLNPELGTEADLGALVAALRRHGMGLVLDVVPNHMGIGGPENRWWWDVLKYGSASRYAPYFDIDWESADPSLRGKVLLPVLGDRYQRVLERGELRLDRQKGRPVLRYCDHQFPLAPQSWPRPGGRTDAALAELNTRPAALDALVRQQHYRLAYWRRGDNELNYRRFFNITTLAGMRVEDPRVFSDTHHRILHWCRRGLVDGLRIDHPDGLRDPEDYLRRLSAAAPRAWIVVEKILEPGEDLPRSWPVAGTTGYDFLNRVNGLFVDPAGERELTEFYAGFTGEPTDFPAIVWGGKQQVLRDDLAAEVSRLVGLLLPLAARHKPGVPASRDDVREALCALAASFPVYRTYVRAHAGQASEADRTCVRKALAAVRRRRPALDPGLVDLLGDLLLLRVRGEPESEFVARFQQLTGAAMAKGVEDTAFYRFNRFIALNEVGGDPGRFGVSVEEFHRACRAAHRNWPHTMVATSTHDTKRSEDVRARLALLSEMAGPWAAAVRRWSAENERHRCADWPDRNAEYSFYQTLVGAWPLDCARALCHQEKAACEAKQETSWHRRNPAYDSALAGFVRGALGDPEFRSDVELVVATLLEPGHINSLAQTLLKLTAPGVPDFYQGAELWDLSLVDPDNRRPVDFALRRRLLARVKHLSPAELWRQRAQGLPKLWLIQRALDLRQRHPDWFGELGDYQPLVSRGAKASHVVAFLRHGSAATVVPRLVLGLKGDWADTVLDLPVGAWRNELTGAAFPGGPASLAVLLKDFPVALLSRIGND